VFGVDEIDIVVTGRSDDGASVSCAGFAKQAPGLKLEVVLIRMGDDTSIGESGNRTGNNDQNPG
jgi:hypothetical protein